MKQKAITFSGPAALLSRIRDMIDAAREEKRQCKRYSVQWHRNDAEIVALSELRDDIKAGRI